MLHPSLIERITRSLAYMLRHQPEQFDLELDEYGYADVGDVVAALNERLGEPVEAEDVVQAVDGGDRPRYEIREGRIRALYGHSIQVKPGQPTKPPPVLYVGISEADAERARRYGLRPGRRSFLHLALTPEDALETGRRASRDYVVITVNALDAWEEGINFYDRKSLYLSDPIPTHFLQVGDVQTDGYGNEEGGERGGRAPRGDAQHRQERPESPRRREWRDRPQERSPERPAERFAERGSERTVQHAPERTAERTPERTGDGPPDRSPDRQPERPADRPAEGRPERSGRGDRPDHGGRDRRGRGEHRGDHRPPRDERSPPRHEPGASPERREAFGRREPPRGPSPSRERPGEALPRPLPASESARASAQPPALRPSSAVPGTFGLGVFEPGPKEKAPPARTPEPRSPEASARDESPSVPSSTPGEKPRQPARAESDDSGFGAGI